MVFLKNRFRSYTLAFRFLFATLLSVYRAIVKRPTIGFMRRGYLYFLRKNELKKKKETSGPRRKNHALFTEGIM